MNTKHATARLQGSVLIEFTLVVLLLLTLMSATWRLGHVMWQESVLVAAVEDAANMVANTPALDMLDQNAADDVTAMAVDMIRDAIDESGNQRGSVIVSCAPASCAASANPARVRVEATAFVTDSVFTFFGYDGFPMTFEMEVAYAGRSPTP